MRISDFPRVKELVELRGKYKLQSQLISEKHPAKLFVHVGSGPGDPTVPEARFVQDMLTNILREIDDELKKLGVKLP